MVKSVTDFILYRWRYLIGYSVLALILSELLVIATIYIPGGISTDEISSVISSNALSFHPFNPADVINLPYYMLQRLSLNLLGVTPFSIKLPSLIFGLLSILGLIILLRTWFRENVTILTTILVVTTGQFLFIAQSGTPSILYVFWSVWLLVAAMMISRGAALVGLWKVALFAFAALSLYTPLSLYILIALGGAVLFHPHLRYIVRRLSKPQIALAFLAGLILISPICYALVKQPSLGLTLLGLPHQMPDIIHNSSQLIKQYVDFSSSDSSYLMTPVYGLASMLLIALGIYRLVTTKYTARSYIISIWIVLLIPILIVNPTFVSVTFVPVVLLMAMGIDVLFRRWYRLFPLNPYARAAGLIPLAVLMASMVLSGIDHYAYEYHYAPNTASHFSKDLRLLDNIIDTNKQNRTIIVTSESEANFYQIIAHHTPNVSIATATDEIPVGGFVVVTHDAHEKSSYSIPNKIITDSFNNNSNRFYIYKTD